MIYNRVGQKIKRARKRKHLSQSQVANLLHCSNVRISNMERGTVRITLSDLERFAEIFGCDYMDFLEKSDT